VGEILSICPQGLKIVWSLVTWGVIKAFSSRHCQTSELPGAVHRARQVADIPNPMISYRTAAPEQLLIANCFRMEAGLELILASQCKSLFSTPVLQSTFCEINSETDGWGCLYFCTECESKFSPIFDVLFPQKHIHLIVWFFIAGLEMKMSGKPAYNSLKK
jgi:hypothetical protein